VGLISEGTLFLIKNNCDIIQFVSEII